MIDVVIGQVKQYLLTDAKYRALHMAYPGVPDAEGRELFYCIAMKQKKPAEGEEEEEQQGSSQVVAIRYHVETGDEYKVQDPETGEEKNEVVMAENVDHLGDHCLGQYYYLIAQKEENLILYVFDLIDDCQLKHQFNVNEIAENNAALKGAEIEAILKGRVQSVIASSDYYLHIMTDKKLIVWRLDFEDEQINGSSNTILSC